MFCTNCGKENPDNASFCSQCGTQLTKPETAPAREETVPALENAVPENPISQEETSALQTEEAGSLVTEEPAAEPTPSFADPEFAPAVKKPKKYLKFAIGGGILLVVLLVLLNISSLIGFSVKTFGSDADYFRYVEKKAFVEYVDSVGSVYGTALENLAGNTGAESEIKFVLSEDAQEFLGDQLDAEMALDWLNEVELKITGNKKDNLQQAGMILEIDGTKILDLDAIINMDQQEIFVGLLNLSDQYLSITGEMDEAVASDASFLYDSEFSKQLPNDTQMRELLNKYLEIVIENLDNVSKSTNTVRIGEIEEKVTVLKFKLNQKNVMQVGLAVLKEIKKDKDIQKYITNISAYLEKEGLIENGDLIYEEFTEAVDSAVQELENTDAEELSDEEILTLTDYVNSNHEVVGRKVEVYEDEMFYYCTAHKGSKFAFEMDVQGVEITGSGTDKSGNISGDFALEYNETHLFDLSVFKFESEEAKKGYLNGTFRITPTSDAYQLLFGLDTSVSTVLSVLDPSLSIKMENDKNSSDIELSLLSKEDVFVGIELSADQKSASKISLPADSNTVDVEDADKWLASLDTGKIISALEKANVPKDIIDLIEMALDQLDTAA